MVSLFYNSAMYKKTAKGQHRKLLKDHNYMPSLNVVSEKGGGSQWNPKKPKKPKNSRNKPKDCDMLFGMRFR